MLRLQSNSDIGLASRSDLERYDDSEELSLLIM